MIIPVLIFSISFYIFSFHLGFQSLQPWDEAWYASIARGISQGKFFLDLHFNGFPFWDHPPLGFFLTAINFKLFGISEFTARLSSALAASLALVFIYLIGKEIKGKTVGIMAALIVISCRWFLLRARTGNLDSLLFLTQTMVFYYAYTLKTKRHYYLLFISFALSLLSKSVISITLLPLVVLACYRTPWRQLIKPFLVFLLIFSPWYIYNTYLYGSQFFIRNIFYIGLRGASTQGVSLQSTALTLLYLRSAIHKWYLPGIASLVLSLFFITKPAVRWVLLYLFLTLFPFFLSSQTQIWHLIPSFAPLALLISFVIYNLLPSKIKFLSLIFVSFVVFISFQSYWSTIVNVSRFTTWEAELSASAAQNPSPLLLQDNTYLPTVIFYADKNTQSIDSTDRHYPQDYPHPFQVLTRTYLLNDLTNYEVIKEREGSSLVIFK